MTCPDHGCNLLGKPLCRIKEDGALVDLLEACMIAEQALMIQYLYMLATMPQVSEAASLAQANSIRSVAQNLHTLSVQEMGHLATACNMLVLFGGTPQFHHNAHGAVRIQLNAESAVEFRLLPLSDHAIDRLIAYESNTEIAILLPLRKPALGTSLNFPDDYEKVGTTYRRVYFETCMRRECDRLRLVPLPETMWTPFYHGGEKRTAISILPTPRSQEPNAELEFSYWNLNEGIKKVLEEGEGGTGSPDDSHVAILRRIKAELPALSGISNRTICDNPSRNDEELCDLARHLLDINSRAYELILAGLYAFWLKELAIKDRQRFYVQLTGFMALILSWVATMLGGTPRNAESSLYLGPTFEVIDEVKTPHSVASALDAMLARATLLFELLNLAVPNPPSGAIFDHETYVLRITNLLRPVTEFVRCIESLGSSRIDG